MNKFDKVYTQLIIQCVLDNYLKMKYPNLISQGYLNGLFSLKRFNLFNIN